MQGLIWTALVWAVTLAIVAPQGFGGFFGIARYRLTREHIAIVVALLGTHTFALVTGAAAVIEDPIVLERVVRGGLSVLALVILLPVLITRLQRAVRLSWPGMTALSIYVLVGLASVLYSVAVVVTAAKVFELGVGLAIIWVIALGDRPRQELLRSIRFVVMLEAALVVAAVIGFFVVPAFAVVQSRPGFLFEKVMQTPYAHSNQLAAASGLVAAYALAMLFQATDRRARISWGVLFAVTSLGVVLASGRQGLVIWVAGVALILWFYHRKSLILLLAPLGVVLVWLNADPLFDLLTRGQASTLPTLTGRVGFWQAALGAWAEHPWTGWGFGAGGRFVALTRIGHGNITSLHSGYMEVLSGVGLLGAIPLGYAAFRVGRWSIIHLRRQVNMAVAILIVPLLLRTSVSNGFAGWLTAHFLIFGFLVAMTDRTNLKKVARSDPLNTGAGGAR